MVYLDGRSADHINGDKLDNRRVNLRECLQGQRDNLQNQRLAAHNSSGYRGVTWDRRLGKWWAKAKIAGEAAAQFRRDHMPFATD